MKTLAHLLPFVFITIFAVSCDENKEDFSSGTYLYTGYDLEGAKAVSGEIILTVIDSRIEGEKDLVLVGSHIQSFDEAGVGPIGGQISDNGEIMIYLLEAHGPYMLIRGKHSNGILTGTRYWGSSGGASEVVIGTFKAKKIYQ